MENIIRTMNQKKDSIPWIEKYRPKKIDNITQDSTLIEMFRNVITTGDISHLLFYGAPGTGKTSAILAIGRELFKEEFHNRIVEFNASDDRGINAVREKITHEAKKYVSEMVSQDGTILPAFKIIILDEADSMTDEAQDALRVIIEEYSRVTRFCFICNYITKITDAIKSRCSIVYFKKLSDECMINKLMEIAKLESINVPDKIFSTIIEVANGDMRKAITILQNLKYKYNFLKLLKIPKYKLTDDEFNFISKIIPKHISSINVDITSEDIYELAAFINMKHADKIIDNIINSKNISQLVKLCREIIASGYPIDGIINQINVSITNSNKFTDKQKAYIFVHSGTILLKMKGCASEYIQLLDFLSCVYSIKNELNVYSII
uniref:AAA+ ATPase domain-containing protein n=1 Tax=viral metagenome TaxID=1070528 RepID=A0A6C0LQP2_9ZZZZ